MPTSGYTAAQDEALSKAYQLLTEHFDCALIIVSSDMEDNETHDEVEGSRIFWSGGYLNALGMAVQAQSRLNETRGYEKLEP